MKLYAPVVWVAMIGLGSLGATQAAAPSVAGCQIFPSNHLFNTRIDDQPVHPQSSAFLQTISSTARKLHLDLGQSEDMRSDEYWGIPYNVVSGSSIAWQAVYYTDGWPDESDCARADHSVASPCVNSGSQPLLPIPASPKVEGGISSDKTIYNDHHILVIETDTCTLWEAYNAYARADGGWDILSSAVFDLKSNALRPLDWTSSDAAGFPIFPLLLRADQASSGEINHALRFTIQSSKIRNSFTWPARHKTNNGDLSSGKPPMGQLFRLKADYPIPDSYGTQAKAILTALKRYGMFIADGGSDMFIQGEPSAQWSDSTVSQVQSVPHTAFEAVDLAPIMARAGFDANSAAVPPAGSAAALRISAITNNDSHSLTLSAQIDVAASDAGQDGQLFVAAVLPGGNFFGLTAAGWQAFTGLAVPAYASLKLGSHLVPVTTGLDVSSLPGLQIYAGYGRNLQDLLAGSKFALIYTVR